MPDSTRDPAGRNPTYWQAIIQTARAGRSGTSTALSGSTLSTTLARATQEASYFALTCGYGVMMELTEYCDKCNNEGVVQRFGRGSRANPTKRCPTCKGKIPAGRIGPFPFKIHPNSVSDLQDGSAGILQSDGALA